MESVKQIEASQQTCNINPDFEEHSVVVPESKEVKTIRCFSELCEEKFVYTWKLFNFNEIPFVNNYPIFSPEFYTGRKGGSRWQIAMTKHTCFHEGGHDDGDYISGGSEGEDESLNASECENIEKKKHEKIKRVGFRLVKLENTSLVWDTVKYSFTLKFSDGTKVSTKEREEPGLANFEGLPKMPRYSLLTEKDFEDGKLFGEKYLEVMCNISFKYIEASSKLSTVNYEGKRFVEDLRVLYVSNKHNDLFISGNEKYYDVAHRIVLHAAIPGFDKLLKGKDLPKASLDLQLDSEVGQAMVNFIYSGEIVNGFPLEKCVDLHAAAKRYGVDCLEEYSSEYFKNNLNSSTCRECLGITDELVDCLRFVKKLGVEKVSKILANEACSHKN